MLMPRSLKVLLIGSHLIDNELNRRALNKAINILRVPVNVDMLPKAEVLQHLTTNGQVACWDAMYMCVGTGLALERPLVKTLAWHPICEFAASFAFSVSPNATEKIVRNGFCPNQVYSYSDSFGGMVHHFEQSLTHVCATCSGADIGECAFPKSGHRFWDENAHKHGFSALPATHQNEKTAAWGWPASLSISGAKPLRPLEVLDPGKPTK